MKKIIFILALFVSLVSNGQKTTGLNYTFINQRYEWTAGIFPALGLPAGPGPAAFKSGQERRAGAVYYDSVGVDSGFYVYTGTYWRNHSVSSSGNNANAGAFYRWLKPATQEIKTFAPGYGTNLDSTSNTDALTLKVDSLVFANRAWVMDRIAEIDDPNLLFDSLGAAGISPMTTWNNTLFARRISISGGSIDTTASGGLLITVTPGTTLTTTDNNLDITGTVLSTQKTVLTLTDGATITWDMTTGYNAEVTLGGNRTLDIDNVQEGDYGTITVFQDGTGSRTLAVPGGTITLNSAASDSTVLSFYYDGNSYAWRDGSKVVLFRASTWANPTSADNITVYKTDVAITVSKVTAVVVGTTPSVTYQINFASDRSSGSPTTLFSSGQVTTSTTTGDEDTIFADATIPAGSYIWITTSAASGTITEMNVTIKYTND